MPHRVVIVGGGIAGLAAAHRLARGGDGLEVTLLEGEDRLGGKIATERTDGFVLEKGPDIFLGSKPGGVGLARELGIEDRLHGVRRELQKTFIMRDGHLLPMPEGLTGLVPAQFGPFIRTRLISPFGKMRMAEDLFIPPRRGGGDESLASFVTRRLGREMYERLVEPLLSGIYAGDGEELSLAATFPQLRQQEIEHGSLVRAALTARLRAVGGGAASAARPAAGDGETAGQAPGESDAPRPSRPAGRAGFLSFPSGLAELSEAAERALDGRVRIVRGVRATRLSPPSGEAGHWTVELADGSSLPADAVVLATPAYVSAELVESFDAALAGPLRAIPYVTTATVSLAYPLGDIPRALDGHGYVIPRIEQRSVLAVTWSSSKLPYRAPEGWVLLRAFLGSARTAEDLPPGDDALLELARAELRDTMGITAPPSLSRVARWDRGMPQYTMGHLDRIAVIDERVGAHAGLHLAGAAYHGVGIPDCIASGRAAAERILQRRDRSPS